MPARSADVVRRRLQAYVDRGVFRGFSEPRSVRGTHAFRFTWLASRPFDLTYEPATRRLTFKRLLPHVPVRSVLYRDLKAFVEGRSEEGLPEHRRVDPKRARVSCVLRARAVSIVMKLKPGNHYEYGVAKIVNLVHEVFVMLHGRHPEYLWEHFDLAEE